MYEPGLTPAEQEERRNARIRRLRTDRETAAHKPRRRLQPVVFLFWLAGIIALTGLLIFIGFLLFAPRLLAWVEDHPTTIDNGIVLNFVEWYSPESLTDTPASDLHRRITVEIPPGSTDSEIGEFLLWRGIIDSRLRFQHHVYLANRSGGLQAGRYDLSPSLLPSTIVASLRQEGAPEAEITLIEGWRLEQIVGYLDQTSLTMDLDEFVELVMHPPADLIAAHPVLAGLPEGRSLEGYLFPDTYRVEVTASARHIVDLLVNTLEGRLTQEMRDAIAARGLTIDQALVVASIVEREAVLDSERPLIAGVYLHRLETPGWRLDADPTLQYGIDSGDYAGFPPSEWGSLEWWRQLTSGGADVVLSETYAGFQTYQHTGLPPWPIASSRLATLEAVAFPDMNAGYFFFVAACPDGVRDGSHRFAVTLAQHEANIGQMNAECP
jgi:UPF0755 protein